MNCRSFFDRLDRLAELGPEEIARMRLHVETCTSCRELGGMLLDGAGGTPPAGLVSSVLAGTTGPACGSARDRLGDLVDDRLDAIDAELVRGHLGDCADCAALERALVALRSDLPVLAELRTDDAFVPAVLARTTQAAPSLWAARLSAGWQRLLARPRLALEGAYLGSIMLFLVIGLPHSVPQKALEVVSVNPVESLRATGIGDWASSETRRVLGTARDRAIDVSADVAASVVAWGAETYDSIDIDLGTFRDRLASGGKKRERSKGDRT